jgi:hypothetical protein
MRQTISAVCAMILCSAALPAFAADDATPHFTKALKAACQPWMEGTERKALSAKLQADGWDATADAIFAKSGSWGRVTAALQQPSGEALGGDGNWLKTWVDETHGTGKPPAAVKRECRIQLGTNDDPWSTQPAVTAAAAWIASTFPKAQKKNSVTTTLDGHPVNATLWSDGKVKITQIVFQTKQSPPNSDVILQVANE